MPIIRTISRGSARSKGFAARSLIFYTANYSSNSTFIVPSGVTSLSIVGKGQDGTYDPGQDAVIAAGLKGPLKPSPYGSSAGYNNYTNPTSFTLTKRNYVRDTGGYSYAWGLSGSLVTVGSGTSRLYIHPSDESWTGSGAVYVLYKRSQWDADNDHRWDTGFSETWGTYQTIGDNLISAWNNTGSSVPRTVSYTAETVQYRPAQSYIAPSSTTGSSTTGFGYTFSGGVGGSASPSTYTKSVSAGQSYSLVIPSGGYINVSYYGY